MILAFLLSAFLKAEEPSETIIVEAHKDFEVYVMPINVINHTDDIEAIVPKNSVYGYASVYNHNTKISNGYGGLEPLTLNHDRFKVYNEDTIEYAWDNCNYRIDAKKCAYNNDHYVLETRITVDTHQLVVNMFLYDSDMQVISRSSITDEKTIVWIKQQKTTYQNQQTVSPQGAVTTTETIIQEPEQLPLKWEIPHFLLERHIHQASLLLWTSARIK